MLEGTGLLGERLARSGHIGGRAQCTPRRRHAKAPLNDGELAVDSEIAGSLWQVKVATGDTVAAGGVLLVIESMKMEISVCAPYAGTVTAVHVAPGSLVRAGQRVAVIRRQ
ncbi:acetyl-CoA carboxylase biotin carboxyl carrier protein subunit [Paraburkholderia sp. BL10I2N1]|uniref:acetyl-CoA carboxylase biotin carboxyl carrier protein subunit n=1 Tax=Paraburkholderia sp. BL10I2N1 TaxID=1938796 RepID=UPI0010E7230E|nr:acetyl-CoA carboxylase biotin carboxyl carrier protein subunit [Paraburkholderia sp. BL10I2N1]TDN62303.1 biotin-dependent enzyme [Paraburkholderia sp. BL10I2N1]